MLSEGLAAISYPVILLAPTNLCSLVHLIWRALENAGCDPSRPFKEAGLNPDWLNRPGARYPWEKVQRLWGLAVDASGDPAIGLAAARLWHPTSLHALGFAWLASSTLKEGLERLVRYLSVASNAADIALHEERDVYRVSMLERALLPRRYRDEALDAGFGIIVRMCRMSAGDDISPVLVVMSRETPLDVRPYQAYFHAQLQFGADENHLMFRKSDLEAPLPTGNAELARVNEQVVVEYLARAEKARFNVRVRHKLIELLPRGDMSQSALANALHVSPRTLQRGLLEEGTSYRKLLDDVRRELAEGYLRDVRHSLGEIAYLLGFSDQANFSRAFKRWTGRTPSELRHDWK